MGKLSAKIDAGSDQTGPRDLHYVPRTKQCLLRDKPLSLLVGFLLLILLVFLLETLF